MNIQRVELLTVTIPFVREFRISSSASKACTHIIVKIHTDDVIGWGECPCPGGPFYCEETAVTCNHVLKDFLVPSVIGKRFSSIEDILACYSGVKRHGFAKAGLETACWDALAKEKDTPLWKLLGGTRTEILSGVSLGIQETIEELYELIDKYLEQGYHRVKLKIGPGRDVEVVRSIRKRYPDLPLTVDANSAYTLKDVEILKRLDEFGLLMIEQPLSHDDIIDHAVIQKELETPICLDESIHTVDDARHAIDLGSCRVINIKTSRVGGLLNAKRIHDYCLSHGVPVWCGGMHEFGVGRAHNIAIASLPGFSLAGDVCGFDKDFGDDITNPLIRAVNGTHKMSDKPGIGYEVNEEKLEKYLVNKVVVEK